MTQSKSILQTINDHNNEKTMNDKFKNMLDSVFGKQESLESVNERILNLSLEIDALVASKKVDLFEGLAAIVCLAAFKMEQEELIHQSVKDSMNQLSEQLFTVIAYRAIHEHNTDTTSPKNGSQPNEDL